MRYNAIIWDFDGTLFDTYPLMARNVVRTLGELGVQAPAGEVMDRLLESFGACMDYFGGLHGISGEALLERYRAVRARHAENAKPFPGVEQLLRKFAGQGGRSFVFTHRGGSAARYLEEAGLAPYFTDIVTWDDRFRRKPDPSGNLHIIGTHALDPAMVLAVGDREIDILAGKAAGTATCLFRSGLPETIADYHIGAIRGLYPILELA